MWFVVIIVKRIILNPIEILKHKAVQFHFNSTQMEGSKNIWNWKVCLSLTTKSWTK